jgi:hypothetical protein
MWTAIYYSAIPFRLRFLSRLSGPPLALADLC